MVFAALAGIALVGAIVWLIRNRNSEAPHYRRLAASFWETVEAFLRGR